LNHHDILDGQDFFMHRRSLALSFRDAFRGIGYVISTQRNAKVQCALGLVTLVAAGILRRPLVDWAILAITIAAVLAAETANTALEQFVNVISPELSEPARIAKDAAAGAVLLVAMGAVAVGLCILGPPLWQALH
jgi:diacylglycerol kinase (ATP)